MAAAGGSMRDALVGRLYKFEPESFAIWMRTMRAVPEAVIAAGTRSEITHLV
jgi:hypothetical protein